MPPAPGVDAPRTPDGSILRTDLRLAGLRRGKVRDVYELPGEAGKPPRLLIVATDRISAFDVVMPTPIPGKGRLLTSLSTFWLRWIERLGLSGTHLVSTDVAEIPDSAFHGTTTRADLEGRIMIARRCRVIPIECVVRGYLEGSGWKEYRQSGGVCGVKLPAGLRQCDRLPEPIFTPATKEELGAHDENITFEQAGEIVGRATMETLRSLSLAIYTAAAEHARKRGIIIADTKFEFGVPVEIGARPMGREPFSEGGTGEGLSSVTPILIDEALTPDSSRFWPADTYEPGRAQVSFDKQYLREYLESLVEAKSWNKQAPGPELPARIIEATRKKYEGAMLALTGGTARP